MVVGRGRRCWPLHAGAGFWRHAPGLLALVGQRKRFVHSVKTAFHRDSIPTLLHRSSTNFCLKTLTFQIIAQLYRSSMCRIKDSFNSQGQSKPPAPSSISPRRQSRLCTKSTMTSILSQHQSRFPPCDIS